MRSFYLSIKSTTGSQFTLPKEESKHACKVLRMKEGDQLALMNGLGDEYQARILIADPKATIVQLEKHIHHPKDNYHIHIALSPTKNIDRFEWFLEKATELGIHQITPLITKNSERSILKNERLEKIIIAAMKQSKRYYLPQLNKLISFDEFISKHQAGLIAHCYDKGTKVELTSVYQPDNCPILIGPEGDFTLEEVDNALASGYKTISLGKTRLRTETAGLYACALAKFKSE